MATSSMYYRYFIFSRTQYDTAVKLNGVNARFGVVYVRGTPKQYTKIYRSLQDIPSDATVLTHGDIRRIKYIAPERMSAVPADGATV